MLLPVPLAGPHLPDDPILARQSRDRELATLPEQVFQQLPRAGRKQFQTDAAFIQGARQLFRHLLRQFPPGCQVSVVVPDLGWVRKSPILNAKTTPFRNGPLSVFLVRGTLAG